MTNNSEEQNILLTLTPEVSSGTEHHIPLQPKVINDAVALAKQQGHNRVLMITIATKPCFYKLWSLMEEAKKQQLPFIILHSGQHYDDLVGHGYEEFNFKTHLGADLQAKGNLSQKAAAYFQKMARLAKHLKEKHPETLFIPYVNGDTISAGTLPLAWLYATNRNSIHGEAALRSMTPKKFTELTGKETPQELINMQWNNDWMINRSEPFPEQVCTFIGSAGSEYYFVPTQLNANHLINEGYATKKIFVVGNTVSDVVAAKKKEKPEKSVFELYPKLSKGTWLRVDIHRRANLNKKRFTAIILAIEQLVEQGLNIAFIELNATKKALDAYGLREKLESLDKKENFLFTPIWKEYAHVLEFFESDSCWAVLTDSGSMQEEMNLINKPCFTLRFSTDRPETVMSKSNLLIPPMNKELITRTVLHFYNNKELLTNMQATENLYGENVAEKIITQIRKLFDNKEEFFSWAHDSLGVHKEDSFLDYL